MQIRMVILQHSEFTIAYSSVKKKNKNDIHGNLKKIRVIHKELFEKWHSG